MPSSDAVTEALKKFWQDRESQDADGFTAQDYLRILLNALRDPSLKLEEKQIQEKYNQIKSLVDRGTSPSDLPYWQEYKKAWITDYGGGRLIPSGKAFITTGGGLYDLNGNPFDPQAAQIVLNEAYGNNRAELDLAQQRIDFDRQEFAYRQEQDRLNQGLTPYQAGQLTLQGQQLDYQRQRDAQDLQLERDKYLSQLKSQPKSWIEAWGFEHPQQQQEPWYRRTPLGVLAGKNWGIMTPQERASVEAMDRTINPRVADKLSYYENPRNELAPEEYSQWYAQLSPERKLESSYSQAGGLGMPKLTIEQAQAIIADINRKAGVLAESEVQSQTTPNTPSWLPQFVPGLEAGKPITQQRARVASGQLWQKTPWSQRQMLGGYLEYASPKGIPTLTDYEEMVQSMLPKNQDRSAKWVSARQ